MRTGALLPAVLAAALAACGGSGAPATACDLLGREEVVAALRDAGVRPASLRGSGAEALDQSVCRHRGAGTSVSLRIDSAPQARRRYFDRVTEALQFSVHDAGSRPRAVDRLGDDDAFGPAGAYWVADLRRLFVLRGTRLFIYQVSAPGLDAERARRAAVRLAAATLPGERRRARPSGGGEEEGPAALELHAPEDGDVVRSGRVVVRGAVTGAGATVRVAGRTAPVRDGVFAREVPLSPGRNRIRVVASARGRSLTAAVSVRRGRPFSALGRAFARRHPGEVPDLLAPGLADARAMLRGAGLRHRVVRLAAVSPRRGAWAVCRTAPRAGERTRGRVVLFVDRADPYRASSTACAQD